MTTVKSLQEDLNIEISSLQERFINRWLPANPDLGPIHFEHDVKAFCVLAHAVFEEFVEELSLLAMEYARLAWRSRRFSHGTIALLCGYKRTVEFVDSDQEDQERVRDQVDKGIEKSRSAHHYTISHNHGFSRAYLRSLFTPVGVDVPDDPGLLQSLGELAEARGSFAHSRSNSAHFGRRKSARKPMTPERAQEIVESCLLLCEALARRVGALTAPGLEGLQWPKWCGPNGPSRWRPRRPKRKVGVVQPSAVGDAMPVTLDDNATCAEKETSIVAASGGGSGGSYI